MWLYGLPDVVGEGAGTIPTKTADELPVQHELAIRDAKAGPRSEGREFHPALPVDLRPRVRAALLGDHGRPAAGDGRCGGDVPRPLRALHQRLKQRPGVLDLVLLNRRSKFVVRS